MSLQRAEKLLKRAEENGNEKEIARLDDFVTAFEQVEGKFRKPTLEGVKAKKKQPRKKH